jgi:hypothetical protein
MITARTILGICLLGCFAPLAQSQGMPFQQLTVGAIDAPGGMLSQRFSEDTPWVKAMRQRLELPGPVTVVTTVVKRFQQEGCARLQTKFIMHEAFINPQGKLEDTQVAVNYNLCRDGTPPIESMDIKDIQRWTSPQAGMSQKQDRSPRVVPMEKPGTHPSQGVPLDSFRPGR